MCSVTDVDVTDGVDGILMLLLVDYTVFQKGYYTECNLRATRSGAASDFMLRRVLRLTYTRHLHSFNINLLALVAFVAVIG